MRKLILTALVLPLFAFASPAHDASKTATGTLGLVKSPQIELCMKNYKEIAAKICKDFRKLDLSKAKIKKAKEKVAEVSHSDNMWWTEERVKDANVFLDSYHNTNGYFRAGQELWCTLGVKKEDEFEKSLAWAEERCRGDLVLSVRKDSIGAEHLSYMFKNLAHQGLKEEAEVIDSLSENLAELRRRTGAFGASEVEGFIVELASAKERASSGSPQERLEFRSMLKDCYEMEKLNPKAFSVRRKNAPSGYDCASFDSKENP